MTDDAHYAPLPSSTRPLDSPALRRLGGRVLSFPERGMPVLSPLVFVLNLGLREGRGAAEGSAGSCRCPFRVGRQRALPFIPIHEAHHPMILCWEVWLAQHHSLAVDFHARALQSMYMALNLARNLPGCRCLLDLATAGT